MKYKILNGRYLKKRRHKIMCCLACGRDTQSSSGLCSNCRGFGSFHSTSIRENKDRKLADNETHTFESQYDLDTDEDWL